MLFLVCLSQKRMTNVSIAENTEEKIDEVVWPSWGVHLCCVKQVDSIFKSEGHQVLRHLRERK